MTHAFPVLNRALAPDPGLLALPEKAVQFGTGALLRGFVDFFVDAANRQGQFNGRIVAIGSTGSGRDRVFNEQDGLFTLATLGWKGGQEVREHRLISSISRAVSAQDEWDQVLACARDPALEVVFSNTTEVGITLDESDTPDLAPPRSFPGKLARFLLERGRAFHFDPARGVVILPCELIEGNGDRLREIVLAHARRWQPGGEFARWVEAAVPFCNTLVDRIVPGTPNDERLAEHWDALGYRDEMLTECEVYRLFAIQGDEALRDRLGFARADQGIVVSADITPFRERKVRLLNGTHTIMVPVALLCGFETVRDAVADEHVGRFARQVMLEEIVPTLEAEGAEQFARDVLDRFANPFIRHALWDITLQATMKLRVRVVPTILAYRRKFGVVRGSLAFGFAAFILFMRGDMQTRAREQGSSVPRDDQADAVRAHWAEADVVRGVCSDVALWGTDLAAVPGFVEAVADHLSRLEHLGPAAALEAHLGNPVG